MVYEVRSRPPNLLKNAQLQISRVLKATCRRMRKELWCSPGYYYQRYYELMLEAVDADGVKFYQAQVAVDSVDDRMWLEVFCVMDDEHYSLRLYHHLEGGSGMTTERPVLKRSQYRAKAEVR
ncbi:hypothetical protein ACFX1X_020041 [Malus domestica]